MAEVLAKIIERAVADEGFRQMLLTNPDKALQGYQVTDEERQLLASLDAGSFDDFAGGLSNRTTK